MPSAEGTRSGIARHRFDAFALTTGLLAIAVAGLSLLSRTADVDVDGLVVLAAVWVVLGAVGLVSVVQRLVSRPGSEEGPPSSG